MEPREITLTSFMEGAAEQLFQEALAKVYASIDDPNTEPKATRRIALVFDVSCDSDRRSGSIEVECTTKIPGPRAIETAIIFGRHQGRFTAVEPFRQEDLFPQPAGRPQPVTVEVTQ